MKYGIKFCGGCNPRYERGKLFNRLKEELSPKITFGNAKEDELYDGLIVFCGCTNCCAAYKHIQTKSDPILVWNERQYDQVIEILSKRMEGKS